MKFLKCLLLASVVALLGATSCAKVETESFDKYEDIALKAWMAKYHPDLEQNLQTEGGYYVDVIQAGNKNAAPVNDTICWVNFDFTGRDLSGNIIMSRNEDDAKLSGTFTKYTHYVPYYRYCGEFNNLPVEGSHLALRNKLILGEKYFADNKDRLGIDSRELLLREGSEVVLYMPSRVVGKGFSGDGGYQGQFSLDASKPLVVRMIVRDTIKNPLANEGNNVDEFCRQGGGLRVYDTEGSKRPKDQDSKDHPYNITEQWVNANDTIPQLYVDYRFDPSKSLKFPETKIYKSAYAPYNAFSTLEQKISEALVKRFHTDDKYMGVKQAGDSVKLEGKANIWYIGRFADGFIFDTNIDEVKQLVYGEVSSKGSALSYTPKEGGMIQAFYYTIPTLRFGQWAALITTSTHGYGSSGKNGGTSTSGGSGYSSNYMDYMNMYNYSNSYYGNNGSYGGYYDGYYGNYMGGMYGMGYGGGYNSSQTGTENTKTTVSTEILPFEPLIFEIYVEPYSD